MKICVYAISKNEQQFVQRFCESAKDADLILIADTGSTDDTAEEARRWKQNSIDARANLMVHDICITPWRFDLARNAALALIPRDIDVCISLDLDEVMELVVGVLLDLPDLLDLLVRKETPFLTTPILHILLQGPETDQFHKYRC